MSFPFGSNLSSTSSSHDPVEKLLGQLAQRAFAGSLITHAVVWAGCGPTDVARADVPLSASQIDQRPDDEADVQSVCNFSDGIIDVNELVRTALHLRRHLRRHRRAPERTRHRRRTLLPVDATTNVPERRLHARAVRTVHLAAQRPDGGSTR